MNVKQITRVECSQGCFKEFRPVLQEQLHGEGVKQCFHCPHCKKVYNVCKITNKGLDIRKQIQAAAKQKDRGRMYRLQEQLKSEIVKL